MRLSKQPAPLAERLAWTRKALEEALQILKRCPDCAACQARRGKP